MTALSEKLVLTELLHVPLKSVFAAHVFCPQVPEPERDNAAEAAGGALVAPSAAPTAAVGGGGSIIAVTAFACRSPGDAINSLTAVDAITPIPLQVCLVVC